MPASGPAASLRVVVDASAVANSSLSTVVRHLITAWATEFADDRLVLVRHPAQEWSFPDNVEVVSAAPGGSGGLGLRLRQQLAVPRLARARRADVVVAMLAASTLLPLPCARVTFVHDMRARLRPGDFTPAERVLRGLSYAAGYRVSAGFICISERTRADFLRLEPSVRGKPTTVTPLGSEHVLEWERPEPDTAAYAEPYAVAFGQYGHKGVGTVLDAWARLGDRLGDRAPRLRLLGLPAHTVAEMEEQLRQRGLDKSVTVERWLPDEEFQRIFAGASLLVFPSEFEGFGLPVLEAMRMGVPVIISPDPALLEVTAGHAKVLRGTAPDDLAALVEEALATTETERAAMVARATSYSWVEAGRLCRAFVASAAGA